MSASIRLNVFAGRPDPEWTIPDAVSQQFLDTITRLPLRVAPAGFVPAWGSFGRPRIGYHGITLRAGSSRAGDYRVNLFDEVIEDPPAGGIRTDSGRELERRLYATAPPEVADLLGQMTFAQLTDRGNEGLIAGLQLPELSHMVCQTGPSLRGDQWIRLRNENNCYNFANDTLNTNEFAAPALPGSLRHLPGSEHTDTVKRLLRNGIESDSLEPINGDRVPQVCPIDGTHYMAVILFHLPGSTVVNDFHCLRLDCDGTWWHKSGSQKPRNTDDSGGGPQVITSLTTALFGGQPVLVGLYRATKDNPRIR